jgi:hypothetical protein
MPIRLFKTKTVHFGNDKKPFCNGYTEKPDWLITSDIKATTCKTCLKLHAEKLGTQFHFIDSVIRNKATGAEEVLSELDRALTDSKQMAERCRGISDICHVVQSGLFTNEELIEAFKNAIVKATMNE